MTGRISRAWGQLRRTPGFGRDVVTVVLTIAIGIGVAGFLLVQQRIQWPWAEDFTFQARFVEAPAISPGNGQEVRIAGVPVGEITDASVSQDGEAQLTLTIKPDYEVYRDAQLVLRPKSPLNEIYVELYPGTPEAGPLPEDGVVASTQTAAPVQADEVLQNLDGTTRSAITTLLSQSDQALASSEVSLAPGLDATGDTLERLQAVSDALDSRRAALAELVTSLGVVAQAVGHDDDRLAALAVDAQETLAALDAKNEQLDGSLAALPDFEASLRDATSRISTLSDELVPTLQSVRRASGELPGALTRLRQTLTDLADLSSVAGPLVEDARPLVRDLRPLAAAGNRSLASLLPFTGRLDSITARMIDRLDYRGDGRLGYLQDFLANTTSVGSLRDGNGGIFRAELVQSPQSLLQLTDGGNGQ